MKPLFILTLLMFTAAMPDAYPKNGKGWENITQEQRGQMAKVHEQFANCLKSDRPMQDCKEEMRETCAKLMGKEGCPMMGRMGMGKRMSR